MSLSINCLDAYKVHEITNLTNIGCNEKVEVDTLRWAPIRETEPTPKNVSYGQLATKTGRCY